MVYCGQVPLENQTFVICFGKNIKKNHFGCNKTFFQKVIKTRLNYSLAKVNKIIN